jgi:hypothetical protein
MKVFHSTNSSNEFRTNIHKSSCWSGASVAVGEIGMVDSFKIIVVPEMQIYEGQGALVTTNEQKHLLRIDE